MPVSRYTKNKVVINDDEQYKDVFNNRGVNSITHFGFEKLKRLKVSDIANIDIVNHTWQSHDRFFKLAFEHYGDSSLWWVIAWFNKTPTESHVELGQIVVVPLPLQKILDYFGL